MNVLYNEADGLTVWPPKSALSREEQNGYNFAVIYSELDITFGEHLPYDVAVNLCETLRSRVVEGEPVPTEWVTMSKTQHSDREAFDSMFDSPIEALDFLTIRK